MAENQSTLPSHKPGTPRGIAGNIAGAIPTLAVLAVIGLAGWWGHHTGWAMPKFSSLLGEKSEEVDWCKEHNVPEMECVECKPELMPKGKARGWCKLHGIPECTLCNPDLAQTAKVPTVSAADLERAKQSLAFTARPENNPICRRHERRIQFATAHDADKSGIEVVPVGTAPALEFISAPGELGYDQTRVAHLSSRSPGTVWRVFKHLGDTAHAGEVLALIDAAEVGKAKAEVLQSFAQLQLRTQSLAGIKESGGVVPTARVREAEAAVRESDIRLGAGCQALTNLGLPLEESEVRNLNPEQLKEKLHWLGLPEDMSRSLDPRRTTSNLLPLTAPMDGHIVSRDVVAGEVVDAARILFEVVDTRSLWITFDVKGEEARLLKIGQPVRFKPDGSKEELTGTLAWISTQADPKTRTVKVRANLADPEGKYRAHTFGSGRVILREEAKVVSVPNEAVQWEGCCHVVFVRDKDYLKEGSPKVFHIRKVRIGAKDDTNTEIIAGVLPGELVVTKGSGLLLTELLRANLGEGCACHSKKD